MSAADERWARQGEIELQLDEIAARLDVDREKEIGEGRSVDVDDLLAEAESQYGQSFVPRTRHSLALSCMMAKRHDLARPLLRANIRHVPTTNAMWGKSVWALARMERSLNNSQAAAESFLQVATNEAIPLRFRLHARLLWATELVKTGQIGAIMLAKDQLSAMLGSVEDPGILMDFARQLVVLSPELNAWAQELMDKATRLAMDQFNQAQHPSAALNILFKVSRRLVYEFNRLDVAIQIWEDLEVSKHHWLWSVQTRYWEYAGLLIYAYGHLNRTATLEQLANEWVFDPSTPAEGRPYVGIPYGQWLMANQRIGEALELYDELIRESPSNAQCAIAWYWKALVAHAQGNMEERNHLLLCMRQAQGVAVGLLSEWKLDAKALLLIEDMRIERVVAQNALYTSDFLGICQAEIEKDLETLALFLQLESV